MPEWSRRFSWGASGTVDLASEDGRAFLQERLAFFGQVAFLIEPGFFLFASAALFAAIPGLVLRGGVPGALVYRLIDLANLGLFLGTWLACRRGRPHWLLRALGERLAGVGSER